MHDVGDRVQCVGVSEYCCVQISWIIWHHFQLLSCLVQVVVGLVWRDAVHSFIISACGMCRIMLLLKYTWQLEASHSTLHPESQNCLKDMRDEYARSGTIWASCLAIRSCFTFRKQVWVEAIMWPSRRVILSGFVVHRLLIIGAFGRISVHLFLNQRYHGLFGYGVQYSWLCYTHL